MKPIFILKGKTDSQGHMLMVLQDQGMGLTEEEDSSEDSEEEGSGEAVLQLS